MTADRRPRRRWFQFGLGTMFLLVTLFALWLAWELNFIHERQAFLAWVDRKNAEVTNAWFMVNPPRVPPATIPFWRRWLGDTAVDTVELPPNSTAADRDRAKALFPEADVTSED
ncbi:MAG: hypothetical protein HYX69_14575 [Planctomycetia bacterium]|nr:hypothetical protein [Planctomycetia bacterium]